MDKMKRSGKFAWGSDGEKNLFEIASRKKYRYPYKGWITTEDLWDLSLDKLDEIYKDLLRKFEESKGESLVSEKKDGDPDLANKIAIIRHIADTRMQEAKDNEAQALAYQKRQKILSILAEKQDDDLRNKSTEELRKMLEEM